MTAISRYAPLASFVGLLAATAARADEAPTSPPVPPPETSPQWEGAIGLRTSYGATYQGAADSKIKLTPGFFPALRALHDHQFQRLRHPPRRRRGGGLGVDSSPSKRFRVNLSLRFDAGRSEDTDPALKGLGDVTRPCARA